MKIGGTSSKGLSATGCDWGTDKFVLSLERELWVLFPCCPREHHTIPQMMRPRAMALPMAIPAMAPLEILLSLAVDDELVADEGADEDVAVV